MKEFDYIKSTNLAKISMALRILGDVMTGENYGISEKERVEVTKKLSEIQDRLYSQMQVTESQ